MKFKKGDALPDWLVNGTAHFGVDVVIEERDGRVWIYPEARLQGEEYMVTFSGEPEFPPFKRLVDIWNEPKA